MNRFAFAALVIILFAPIVTYSQVHDGTPLDSITIRFSDTLSALYLPDSSAIPLWQIGHSHKSFFGADSAGITMMTDTVKHYPKNANNWFVIRVPNFYDVIVDFWHKYQTDTGRAGGVVEFSFDKGIGWQNVKGDCNIDDYGWSGIHTTNFYSKSDTIASTGDPSFTGFKDSLQFSRLQFYNGQPFRTTGGTYCFFLLDTIYVRFRFISDTTADSLAGWEIDSIKIERDSFNIEGYVKPVNRQQLLHIYPNPSYDGTFVFPALNNEQNYTFEVYNTIGERVFNVPYTRSLDLSNYPKGLYFYKVSDGTEYFSGRLLIE